MSVNGTLVENKMGRFKGEGHSLASTNVPFTFTVPSAKFFSTYSHERDNSVVLKVCCWFPFLGINVMIFKSNNLVASTSNFSFKESKYFTLTKTLRREYSLLCHPSNFLLYRTCFHAATYGQLGAYRELPDSNLKLLFVRKLCSS